MSQIVSLADADQTARAGIGEVDPEWLVADGAVGGASVAELAGIIAQGRCMADG